MSSSKIHDQSTARTSPTRAQIEAAEAKAASICNLPHEDGVGCIKCTGLTKAELNGQLTSPIVRAEQDAENIGPKIARSNDTCGACENGVAQHEVAHTRENNEAARDLSAAALPDKEHQVVPEPGKDKPFYGTEWAGRTAPDGTQVPQLAVCDFGYGHNAAPNARDSQNAPVPTPQGRILEPQL